MASAPITVEPSSDLQIIYERKASNSPVTDVTIAQLLISKTSPPAPLTPLSALSGKRQRLKPTRFDFASFKAKKKSKSLFSKDKAEDDPSGTRLGKENGAKISKALVQPSQTMIRAAEIQATLGNEYPSFMKTMVKSHVVSCFWLGLPFPFCRSFLPKVDSLMVLEDENGGQLNVKYIAYRFGLSGGWKRFSIEHKLLEGDVLIFQLVESTKFKVYVVRASGSKEADDAVMVINQDAHALHVTPAIVKTHSKSKGRKRSSSDPVALTKVKRKYVYKRSKRVNSQVEGCLPDSEPNLSVKSFKDFHIMVNKQCIDSELSKEIRMSYYNLCVGKNEILHKGVREGLYNKLVAGVIGETVNIANKLRNCKLTTRKEEFDAWDSSLESFELIGMKVGFLRDRIRALTITNLAFESDDAKRYLEAKDEQSQNANEIKILEAKLVELYESNRKIGGIVDGLKEKVETYETEFQKKVDAPW